MPPRETRARRASPRGASRIAGTTRTSILDAAVRDGRDAPALGHALGPAVEAPASRRAATAWRDATRPPCVLARSAAVSRESRSLHGVWGLFMHRSHWQSTSRVAAALAACALPARAWAFDPIGHDVIEAQAYRRLLDASPSLPDGVGGTVRGDVVVAALIADGVLAAPGCFGASAGSSSCREARAREPTRWWPPLRSGRMDFVLDRHFGAVGQCYHFLAHPGDDDAPHVVDPATAVPAGLVARPYRRCVRLVGTLVEVAAGAGAGDARGIDNDVYALLHALADAHSAAHVERDARGRIRWMRVWNALPWNPRGDARLRHRFHDDRDEAFLRPGAASDPRCDLDRTHPYAVAPSCLSPAAASAVDALVDVLALVYRMRRRARAGLAPPNFTAAVNRDDWSAFVARHLRHARVPLDGSDTRPYRLDAWPRVAFGIGVDLDGPDARPGAHVGVMTPLFLLGRDRFLPFVPNASVELGVLPGDGYHAAADVTFSLPFAPWLWAGLAPFRVSATMRPQRGEVDVAVGLFAPRVDVFQIGRAHRGLWLRVAGPGMYDLVSARWQWQAALTLGLHFDTTLDVQPALTPQAPRSNRRGDDERAMIRAWNPPAFGGATIPRWPAQTYVYVSFGGRTGGGVGGGVSALRSLPGVLHHFDVGALLDASGPGGAHDTAFDLGLVVRLRPRPFFSVDLVPVGAGVELSQPTTWTLTARLGASVMVGPLRVSVELPRFDYRQLTVDTDRGVDLRFGVDLTEVFGAHGTDVAQGADGLRGGLPVP